MSRAAVVGAGVLGRLLSLRLREAGWDVTLFDRDTPEGRASCTWVGAGMLSPYCEREAAERIITDLGVESMELWRGWLKRLPGPIFYREAGSMVVAHPSDRDELERLRRRVKDRNFIDEAMQELDAPGISALEPDLAGRFPSALYFPLERHIDNRDLLRCTTKAIADAGITFRHSTDVVGLAPHTVTTSDGSTKHDWVFDCRGMGAKADLTDLRGVRGELLYLKAPEVNLQRPVRLMHPRYSIYIVPRADHVYVVGATMIESDDMGPISVRSSLELLSAAYSVHTGFAEARLLEATVHCRPGFPNNHPRFIVSPGLMRINGLFRHGFLISPALVEAALSHVTTGKTPEQVAPLWREATG